MALDDDAVIAAQLGRAIRAPADVAVRCRLDLPVVTRVPPSLASGEPFPTRFWLTCPLADRRIARIEGVGGVRDADARVANDPELAAALARAEKTYADERDAAHVGDGRRATGGVGGAVGGVKCLHAHYAHYLATGENPVGASIEARVGALDCATACVREIDGRVARHPEWREPG